jgi:ribulose-bisphosphate carboxylase large chain
MHSFRATYRVASFLPIEQVAATFAGEQSSGTFVRTPLESDALRERHAATVERIDPIDNLDARNALPGSLNPAGLPFAHAALVTVAYPVANVGTSMASLFTTVAGNLFELEELAAVKLVGLHAPRAVLDRYPGPEQGLAGTRRLIGADEHEPIIGTIIKPSVGLSLEDHAGLVRELAGAGLDFIKDDELTANPPHAPLSERIRVSLEEIARAADTSGRRTMYAFNISDDIDTMLKSAEAIEKAGGTCVMVTVPVVGLAAVEHLRRNTSLAIHGHRAAFEAMGRSRELGIAYTVYQQFMRMAGTDHLHIGGFDSKFFADNEMVLENFRAVSSPLGSQRPVMPVLSAGQSAATAQSTFDSIKTTDVMVLAGGGIVGHPGGVRAGVASLRSAWAALGDGVAVAERAESDADLATALVHFDRSARQRA